MRKGVPIAVVLALSLIVSSVALLAPGAKAAGTYPANLSPQAGDKGYAKASGGANCFIQAGSPWLKVHTDHGITTPTDWYRATTTFADSDSIRAQAYVELHAPGWFDEAYYALEVYHDGTSMETKSGSNQGDWGGWVTTSTFPIGSSDSRWRFILTVWGADSGVLQCSAKAEFQVVDPSTVCGSVAYRTTSYLPGTDSSTSIGGVFVGFAKGTCQTGTTGIIDFYGSGWANGHNTGWVTVYMPSSYSVAFAWMAMLGNNPPCAVTRTISGNYASWEITPTGYPYSCPFVVTVGGVMSGWPIPSCSVQVALRALSGGEGYKTETLVFCSGANNNFVNQIAMRSPSSRMEITTGATLETGEPRPCGSIGATVWFSVTAGGSGTAVIDTVGGLTNYDTVLAAYTGSSLGGLTNIACNDDYGGLQSQITFACTVGTTYRVQLGGYNGAAGRATLDINGC